MAQHRSTRKCRYCGYMRPLDQFEVLPSGRRARGCYICREQRKRAAAAEPGWDWASAVHKSASMGARHQILNPERLFSKSLTPEVVRALMAMQAGRCALTRNKFVLPGTHLLAVHETFDDWLRTLPLRKRLRTPVMVRLDSQENWEPGNVILIYQLIKSVYEYHGCAKVFRRTMEEWGTDERRFPSRVGLEEECRRIKRERDQQ